MFSLLALCVWEVSQCQAIEISLSMLYPITVPSSSGAQRAAAALLAIEEINSLQSQSGITFRPLINDTGSDPAKAVKACLNHILTINDLGGIVGAAASAISRGVQLLATTYQIPQISYASTASDLSNRAVYPYFMRTVPSDANQGAVLAQLVNSYGWKRVAWIFTNDDYGSGIFNDFQVASEAFDFQILAFQAVNTNPSQSALSASISVLRSSDARVFLVAASGTDASSILTEAGQQGLSGSDYVWIGSDGVAQDSVVSASTIEVMRGMIGVSPGKGIQTSARYMQFKQKWGSQLWNDSKFDSIAVDGVQYLSQSDFTNDDGTPADPNIYSLFSYDTIYVFFEAWQNLNARGVDTSSASWGKTLLNELYQTVYSNGLTGEVVFNGVGDRLMPYTILNLAPNPPTTTTPRPLTSFSPALSFGVSFQPIGYWTNTDNITRLVFNQDALFYSGTAQIPHDSSFPYYAGDEVAVTVDPTGAIFGLGVGVVAAWTSLIITETALYSWAKHEKQAYLWILLAASGLGLGVWSMISVTLTSQRFNYLGVYYHPVYIGGAIPVAIVLAAFSFLIGIRDVHLRASNRHRDRNNFGPRDSDGDGGEGHPKGGTATGLKRWISGLSRKDGGKDNGKTSGDKSPTTGASSTQPSTELADLRRSAATASPRASDDAAGDVQIPPNTTTNNRRNEDRARERNRDKQSKSTSNSSDQKKSDAHHHHPLNGHAKQQSSLTTLVCMTPRVLISNITPRLVMAAILLDGACTAVWLLSLLSLRTDCTLTIGTGALVGGVIIMFIGSLLSLLMFFYLKTATVRFSAAFFFAAALVGLLYTGMAGVRYTYSPGALVLQPGGHRLWTQDDVHLVAGVVIAVTLFCFMGLNVARLKISHNQLDYERQMLHHELVSTQASLEQTSERLRLSIVRMHTLNICTPFHTHALDMALEIGKMPLKRLERVKLGIPEEKLSTLPSGPRRVFSPTVTTRELSISTNNNNNNSPPNNLNARITSLTAGGGNGGNGNGGSPPETAAALSSPGTTSGILMSTSSSNSNSGSPGSGGMLGLSASDIAISRRPSTAVVRGPSFSELLRNPICFEIFKQYAHSKHGVENLQFVVDVDHYRLLKRKQRVRVSEMIFHTYIVVNSEREVNISSKVRKQLLKSRSQPSKTLFDNAKEEVWKLLNTNYFLKFRDLQDYVVCASIIAAEEEKKFQEEEEEDSDDENPAASAAIDAKLSEMASMEDGTASARGSLSTQSGVNPAHRSANSHTLTATTRFTAQHKDSSAAASASSHQDNGPNDALSSSIAISVNDNPTGNGNGNGNGKGMGSKRPGASSRGTRSENRSLTTPTNDLDITHVASSSYSLADVDEDEGREGSRGKTRTKLSEKFALIISAPEEQERRKPTVHGHGDGHGDGDGHVSDPDSATLTHNADDAKISPTSASGSGILSSAPSSSALASAPPTIPPQSL